VRWQPKTFKTKPGSRGAIRLKSTQIKWFSWWPGGRLDCVNGGLSPSKGKLENNSGKLRDLTTNRHSDNLKNQTTYYFLGDDEEGRCCCRC
jgi:hypothetical protein